MTELYFRQKQWADVFITQLPLLSVAAAIGNCTEENQAKPVTTGPLDHGSQGGFQWRGERLDGPEGLLAYCQAKGYNWQTIDAQARFFLWECRTKYPRLWSYLANPGQRSLQTLVWDIMQMYEMPNPALAHGDVRLAEAQKFLDQYKLELPKPPVPVPAPTPVSEMPASEIINILVQLAPLFEAIIRAAITAHAQTQVAAPPPPPMPSTDAINELIALLQKIKPPG